MNLVAILSAKGGACKTTLAQIIAASAAADNISTLLIDCNHVQQTAANWARRRNQPGGPKTSAPLTGQIASRDTIAAVIEAAKARGVGLCVIDTGPAADYESELAARAAHLVLVACQPSINDIETLGETFSLSGIGSKPAFVVLTRTPTNDKGKLAEDAAALIQNMGYKVAGPVLPDRVIYKNALTTGRTGGEAKGAGAAAAAEDAAALWQFVKSKLKAAALPRAQGVKP